MYILKILLCIVILEISSSIGMIFSKKLDKRVKEYVELENILVYIKANIEYLQQDILQIFEELYNQYKGKNWGTLFKGILDEIKFNKLSLDNAITKSIDKYSFMFCADLSILKNLSSNLGKTDIDNQISNLIIYQQRVKELIITANENKKKNEKMYRSLGIICGIMIVIVLI